MTRTKRAAASVLRAVPTLLVFGLLAGVGYWGHHYGWKVPKWSELTSGGAKPVSKEDWCAAHNVPDSKCIACHPELAGEDVTDWCKEHGVRESECTICHPEILTSGKAADWCKEHGVPESQCDLCHPEIIVKGKAPSDPDSRTVSAPDTNAKDPLLCRTHLMRVQFASTESVRKAGLKLVAVEERPIAAVLRVNGEIRYIDPKTARVTSRVPGIVSSVEKRLGDVVKLGEVLALLDAAEVGRAKSEFLQALSLVAARETLVAKLRTSLAEGFRTQTEVVEAETGLREAAVRLYAAQQSLANLGLPVAAEDFAKLSIAEASERLRLHGLPEDVAARLAKASPSANLVAVVAPIDGIVTAANAVKGDVVDATKPLFSIADTSKMWVALAVSLEDAPLVALGQRVVFVPDGVRDEATSGAVVWISTAADETTRTVEVRAELPNEKGQLRASAFGSGRIILRQEAKATAVPVEAVNWEGCCYVVFVRLSDEIFQTRKIKPGVRQGAFQEVLAGVSPGEVVVGEGSNVLRSDILRGNLGAG